MVTDPLLIVLNREIRPISYIPVAIDLPALLRPGNIHPFLSYVSSPYLSTLLNLQAERSNCRCTAGWLAEGGPWTVGKKVKRRGVGIENERCVYLLLMRAVNFFKSLVKKILPFFSSKGRGNGSNKTAFPNDRKLTLSDLMEEMKHGKREQIGQVEMDWARQYERSLIPEHYRFPKLGDLYESKTDQKIKFLTSWAAPYSGGGEGILFKGERIWVDSHPDGVKPIGTFALPVNYRELETRMVSQSDRNAFKYGGFYFYISTVDLNEKFILLQTAFTKEKHE
jgi:hypothetical protein